MNPPTLRHLSMFVLAALACTKNSLPPRTQTKKDPAPPAQPDAAVVKGDARTPAPDAADGAFPIRVIGGARLKAMYARTADGEKYFRYIYFDTTLKIPCFFNVAQDGKNRCLPLGHQKPLTFFNAQTCGQILLPADEACAGGYALQTVGGRTSVFKLGPAITPTTAFARYNPPLSPPPPPGSDGGVEGGVEGGTLSCWPNANVAGQKFFSLGAAVPPEMFVGAEEPHPIPEPGRRIIGFGRAAEDGSKERTAWYDSRLAQRCFIDTAKDGEQRCVPWSWLNYPNTYFADAACTQRVAASTLSTAPSPYFVRTSNSTTCPGRATYYTTQPRRDLTTVYTRGAAGCGPAAGPVNAVFYELGAEVPPTDFQKFTETREGTGRLRRRVLTDPDGAIDRLSNPFDSDMGERCDWLQTSDGTLRCLPPATGRTDLFSDATCSRGAAIPGRSLACEVTALQTTQLGGPWCAPVAQVFTLANPSAPMWQRDLEGACVPTAVRNYYAFDVARPPGDFVTAEAIQE